MTRPKLFAAGLSAAALLITVAHGAVARHLENQAKMAAAWSAAPR